MVVDLTDRGTPWDACHRPDDIGPVPGLSLLTEDLVRYGCPGHIRTCLAVSSPPDMISQPSVLVFQIVHSLHRSCLT